MIRLTGNHTNVHLGCMSDTSPQISVEQVAEMFATLSNHHEIGSEKDPSILIFNMASRK